MLSTHNTECHRNTDTAKQIRDKFNARAIIAPSLVALWRDQNNLLLFYYYEFCNATVASDGSVSEMCSEMLHDCDSTFTTKHSIWRQSNQHRSTLHDKV